MICIHFDDPATMRYPTAGDWEYAKNGDLVITVAVTGNRDYDVLVAVHELVEAVLCDKSRITEEIVTRWDLDHPNSVEPGELAGCPYKDQHTKAGYVERAAADALGVDWDDYEEAIDAQQRAVEKDQGREPDLDQPAVQVG